MAAAASGTTITQEFLARGAAVIAYTHTECVAIVNEAFALAGSVPVYKKSALQRRWRDVRCAAQHYGASPSAHQRFGASLVSGEKTPRFGLSGLKAGQPPVLHLRPRMMWRSWYEGDRRNGV